MRRRVFRFVRQTAERAAAAMRSIAAADGESADRDRLDRQSPAMTDRDEAIFLLQTAAEIEHSLLVQYLYAAFSLNNAAAPTRDWRDRLTGIAREEMAHLLAVQNLLLLLGGPLNLEREDYPFNEFYPYPFQLETASRHSIAKYVLAEMPEVSSISDPEILADLHRIREDAAGGMPESCVEERQRKAMVLEGRVDEINRVGLLFEALIGLVNKLSEDDFFADSVPLHGTPEDGWAEKPGMLYPLVTNKQQALAALQAVAEQGEGSDSGDDLTASHFFRFYRIWKEMTAANWEPDPVLPTNPTTNDQPRPNETYIANETARAWAELFDTQYRMLLAALAHHLTLPRQFAVESENAWQQQDRRQLVRWAVIEMFQLTSVADKVTALDLAAGDVEESPRLVAGPPFQLPFTLQLADRETDRWRHHKLLVAESRKRIKALRELGVTDDLLVRLASFNAGYESYATARESGSAPPSSGSIEDRMRQLLADKRDQQEGNHDGVETGAVTLSQLFEEEKYNDILEFLRTGESIDGGKLIVPGKPDESKFYLQITEGVMAGEFSSDEEELVKTWIEQMTPSRFQEVVGILDEAVGGAGEPVGGTHGAFWRDTTRDQFVALQVPGFGEQLPLLVIGDGAGSNLVKALKGAAPFGTNIGTPGARYRRMPAGDNPVPPAKIAIIEKWIDDGCPERDPSGAGQLQWRKTNAPVASSRTDDIWFLDPDTGWAVNSNGQILKTEDGGTSWTEQLQTGAYLRSVGFTNESVGWVGTLTANRRLFHTKDGGATWSQVTNIPATPSAICGLYAVNESVMYGSGTNYPDRDPGIIKTTDGGQSWTAIDMKPYANLLVDCYFADAEHGWVVGGRAEVPNPDRDDVKPVVLYTENGGQSWEDRVAGIRDTFPSGEWGWKIQFLNDRVGFVSLENFHEGAILVTNDGGETWVRKVINDPQRNANLEGVGFIDEHHGWVGGWGDASFQGGFSSETSDGGDSWRNANHIGFRINRFRFFGDPVTVGYASGETVYKYSADPVDPPPSALAAGPSMFQTTEPEEFLGDVDIRFEIPADTGRAELMIWDRFGGEVCKVLDESKPAKGLSHVVWRRDDASHAAVAPGPYICRLTVDGKAESRLVWLK